MANDPNFIPEDLRTKLEADAAEARRKGDRNCAEVLIQLAAYRGNDAAQFARDLGAESCTVRYGSAKELLTLVVQSRRRRRRGASITPSGGGTVDAHDGQARDALLAYAKEKFPTAGSVRLLRDDFDREIVGVVQFKFSGARVNAGFSRELWDRAKDFGELRAHMERHDWQDTVDHAASQRALLGQNGWLEWK